jgi:hypothetical protein
MNSSFFMIKTQIYATVDILIRIGQFYVFLSDEVNNK